MVESNVVIFDFSPSTAKPWKLAVTSSSCCYSNRRKAEPGKGLSVPQTHQYVRPLRRLTLSSFPKIKTSWVWRPENPKAKRHIAHLFLKILWCGQLCSARNRRKIFIETWCALMVSGATIHHSMPVSATSSTFF